MSRRNILGVYDIGDPSFNIYAFRLHLLKLRLDTIYFRIKFFYSELKGVKSSIICHWIAFRHWILTGEIMQSYLDLLEDQRDESGSSDSE